MPITREEHIDYTRNELMTYQYYIDVIEELKNDNIKSYIDVGANVGEFCNVLFECIPTLENAYLIEPEDNNYNFMVSNVKNGNILFYKCAIGYNYNSAILVSHSSKNVGGFILTENKGQKNSISIELKTLEDLDLPIVDLIKIDIEGGEYNIIENSSYLKNIKWIEIEFHRQGTAHLNTNFVEYVNKYLPEHEITVIEPDLYARILLKKINRYEKI